MEDTKQDLVAHRQDAVDLGAGEGRVQEESQLDVLLLIADLLAQHGGQEHEVVIMDPDHVIVLDILGDSLCKQAIRLLVSLPCRLVEGDLTGVVVEEGP